MKTFEEHVRAETFVALPHLVKASASMALAMLERKDAASMRAAASCIDTIAACARVVAAAPDAGADLRAAVVEAFGEIVLKALSADHADVIAARDRSTDAVLSLVDRDGSVRERLASRHTVLQ